MSLCSFCGVQNSRFLLSSASNRDTSLEILLGIRLIETLDLLDDPAGRSRGPTFTIETTLICIYTNSVRFNYLDFVKLISLMITIGMISSRRSSWSKERSKQCMREVKHTLADWRHRRQRGEIYVRSSADGHIEDGLRESLIVHDARLLQWAVEKRRECEQAALGGHIGLLELCVGLCMQRHLNEDWHRPASAHVCQAPHSRRSLSWSDTQRSLHSLSG